MAGATVLTAQLKMEEKEDRKNRAIAFVGTTIIFSTILLIVLLIALTPPVPPLPEVDTMAIVLGSDEVGMNNTFDPVAAGTPQPQEAVSQSQPAPQQQTVTSTEEDAPPIEKPLQDKKTTAKPAEQTATTQTNTQPEQQVNKNALFTKSDKNGNNGPGGSNYSKGTGNTPGDQGSPDGDPDAKSWIGGGLKGRGVMALPKPEENFQVEGIVVVDVCVNPDGTVATARGPARGTTVTLPAAVAAAELKAKEARFKPDPDAPSLQCGTISYRFVLQ